MTEDRSQQFDRDLTAVLRQAAGDGAPASLRYRLADVTATPPVERRSRFAPPLRWAAVGVAVVAVAVLAFLMIPHENVGPTPTSSAQPTATPAAESGSPTPSGEASPTGSPSVPPSPTVVPTQAPAAWSTLTWSEGVPAPGNVLDVVAWGDAYVGVGTSWGAGEIDAGFFTSADGLHWTRSVQLSTSGDVWAQWVVPVGNKLLAIGNVDWQGASPDWAPPLWTSLDGKSWAKLDSPTWDAILTEGFRGSVRLASGPRGVVAVRLGTKTAVLYSPDGATWTRASLPAAARAIPKDVIASADGFVIVGRDGDPDIVTEVCDPTCPPPGTGKPAAWISADGAHWTEASVEGTAVPGGELRKVLPTRGGYMALGIDSGTAAQGDTRPLTTWTSTDGARWLRAGTGSAPPGTAGYLPTIASDGEHLLVFGVTPGSTELGAWASTDGLSWTPLTFQNADAAPVIDCTRDVCFHVAGAWIEPDRVIVVGGGDCGVSACGTSEYYWLATPGP
jgi:hypothetical protein